MQYRIVRTDNSEEPIEHGLFGKKGGAQKGSTWDNHKYIARQKLANGWRYFYSQAELRAAQAKQAGQKAASAVGNAAKKGVANVKRAGSKAADIASGKYARELDERRGKAAQTAFLAGLHGETKRLNATGENGSYKTAQNSISKYNGLKNSLESLEQRYNSEIEKYKAGDTSSINKLEKLGADIDSTKKKVSIAESQAKKDFSKAEQDKYDIARYEYAGKQAEKERDRLDEERKGIAYKISDLSGKAKKVVDSGKSAVSKFLSDESAMAKEAWNGSVAKKAIDKGKNAVDNLMLFAKEHSAKQIKFEQPTKGEIKVKDPKTALGRKIQEIRDSHTTINGVPLNELKAKREAESSKTEETKEIPKNTRQYNGTSQKAEGDDTRATKDMYKNSSDEYIEALYSNSRKNDGSGVSKELEVEYNYRKAAQEANYLGRLTDSYSDDAEQALQKYGKDSPQYKKAYDKMEDAFDQLHDAEVELERWEKQR